MKHYSSESRKLLCKAVGIMFALLLCVAFLPGSVKAKTRSYTDSRGIKFTVDDDKQTAVVVDGKACKEKKLFLDVVSVKQLEEAEETDTDTADELASDDSDFDYDYDDEDIDDDDEAVEEEYIITSIGKNAFKGNNNIQKVFIESHCTSIGAGAFQNMKNLKSAEFGLKFDPLTTTKQGKQAKITIGKNAFAGCKKLGSIYSSSTYVKSIGKNAFKDTKKGMTILLAVYGKDYKTNKQFKTIAQNQIKKYQKLLKSSNVNSPKFQAEQTENGGKVIKF